MRHHHGNIWDTPAAARVITTNGSTRMDGAAIMGRGVARQCREQFPEVPLRLGVLVRQYGNRVHVIRELTVDHPPIVSFPVKHYWGERADIRLIERSASQLMTLIKATGWAHVVMPRPGCGNGGLDWSEVEPRIADILDDRVIVVWEEGHDASADVTQTRW